MTKNLQQGYRVPHNNNNNNDKFSLP